MHCAHLRSLISIRLATCQEIPYLVALSVINLARSIYGTTIICVIYELYIYIYICVYPSCIVKQYLIYSNIILYGNNKFYKIRGIRTHYEEINI